MKKLTKEQQLAKKTAWQQKLVNKGNALKENANLCPRCIFKEQDLVLSSEGYFTPCCWLDDELYRSQPYVNDFFKPYLNIENNDNIQDIFDSKEWQDFWDILLNRPEDAPPVCYEYCASQQGDKEYLDTAENIDIIRKH
jgi:hypothetical protein